MQLLIVAVKDRALNAYRHITAVQSEGQAIRTFQDAINDQQSGELYKHPDDFELYVLAVCNDETGQITATPAPKKIADGKQLKTS